MPKINKVSETLFSFVDGHTIPNPKNQYALVLYTLINPPKEISQSYWASEYHILKWSTRLGELEKKLGMDLVDRHEKEFVNRFSHSSNYTVYTPILEKSKYIELYKQVNNG